MLAYVDSLFYRDEVPMILHLDFETYSEADLPKVGSYKYAEHESTWPYVCCYRFDDGDIRSCDPCDNCPDEIYDHIKSGGLVCAHNTAFERDLINNCFGEYWPDIKATQCLDTMAMAACVNLPLSLANVGKALGIEHEKDSIGGATMKLFMKPMPDGGDAHKTDFDDWPQEKYDAFFGKTSVVRKEIEKRRGDGSTYDICLAIITDYCRRDVEAECDVYAMLPKMTEMQLKAYHRTLEINDRGIPVDLELASLGSQSFKWLKEQAEHDLTEFDVTLDTLMSPTKFLKWMASKGHTIPDLRPQTIASIEETFDRTVRVVVNIRNEVCSSSLNKFDAILDMAAKDGRVHGSLFFHSAITGRWGGRGLQPQNLPRPAKGHDVQDIIRRLKDGEQGSAAELKSIVRACIQCDEGFTCADWANVEGRMLAWLAGEDWKLQAFREYDEGTGPDLYKLTYARAYGIPVEDVTDEQRSIGKVMELAFGYGGGKGAVENFAPSQFTEAEKVDLQTAWREANPNIVKYWHRLERASTHAMENPGIRATVGRVSYKMEDGHLYCSLPSGRKIRYTNAHRREVRNRWGNLERKMFYKTTKLGRWMEVDSWFGIKAENVTQGACACLMMEALERPSLSNAVMIVHDEGVADSATDLDKFIADFCIVPEWAEGLPLSGEGWVGEEYRK